MERPSIRLLSKASDTQKGLLVAIVDAATPGVDGKTVFSYRITNLLEEEEVFVEMPSDLRVGYSYEGLDGSAGAGAGSSPFFRTM